MISGVTFCVLFDMKWINEQADAKDVGAWLRDNMYKKEYKKKTKNSETNGAIVRGSICLRGQG